jgi:iron complex transport system substrate-binding protein
VGRDEFSDFPVEAKDLPSIGGGFGDYNQEAIVDLEPDLVLAAEINTPEQVQSLADLGLNVFWLKNPATMDEMYANLQTVGRLTGHETEAVELSESLKARVADVDQAVSGASEAPTVFYELDGSEPNAPWTAGPGTFIDTLIRMAGGENVAGDVEGQYVQISLEKLVVEDPAIILLGDAAYGVTPESVGQRAGWESLAAVENERIYPFDDNLVSRPGPRLVEGLETLAKLIHPELFE